MSYRLIQELHAKFPGRAEHGDAVRKFMELEQDLAAMLGPYAQEN